MLVTFRLFLAILRAAALTDLNSGFGCIPHHTVSLTSPSKYSTSHPACIPTAYDVESALRLLFKGWNQMLIVVIQQ